MPVIKPLTSGSGEAPKTFSQPSRKGKKAWRKNVDVTDVQKGLENLNEEIIQGGVVKERPSADLFAIETTRSEKATQRHKQAAKKLKSEEIIASRSAVPAVSMRKRPGKVFDASLPAKRQRTGGDWVSHKELARLKRVADGQHEDTVEVQDASYDMWSGAAPTALTMKKKNGGKQVVEKEKAEEIYDFLPEKEVAKVPKSMKQKALSLLANGKTIPAVQKPTGGYSYNPVFEEYESRLNSEGQKAVEAEQKRLQAEAEELQRQEAAAKSAAEADAAEAKAELSEWEEDSEWEGFQSGAENDGSTTKLNSKRPERKTQAQRNRIKRRKEEERLAKHKAAMKVRRAQEEKIKEIAEMVSEKDKAKALMALAAQDSDSEDYMEGEEQKLRRRQIGKYKLPEKDLELVLPDELTESLRLLKPEGNLLKDRYRSMLVRGKVESRRHLPFKKKANRKVTEKWTHKDFVI